MKNKKVSIEERAEQIIFDSMNMVGERMVVHMVGASVIKKQKKAILSLIKEVATAAIQSGDVYLRNEDLKNLTIIRNSRKNLREQQLGKLSVLLGEDEKRV